MNIFQISNVDIFWFYTGESCTAVSKLLIHTVNRGLQSVMFVKLRPFNVCFNLIPEVCLLYTYSSLKQAKFLISVRKPA